MSGRRKKRRVPAESIEKNGWLNCYKKLFLFDETEKRRIGRFQKLGLIQPRMPKAASGWERKYIFCIKSSIFLEKPMMKENLTIGSNSDIYIPQFQFNADTALSSKDRLPERSFVL